MKNFSKKTAGIIMPSELKTFKGKLVYSIIMIMLIIICAICLLPTVWTLLTGFKTSQEMYSSSKLLPENMSWAWIKSSFLTAWKAMNATKSSLNTLFISFSATIFCIVVDGLGGYVLSRLKPRGIKLAFVLIVWTMMMPSQIRTVPLYISYINWPFIAKTGWQISLLDTYWPMILGSATGAFSVILFKNSFDSVSMSLVEAAKLDGCGNMRIFFNIMMPLSVPVIIYVAIGAMRAPWGNFFTPYLILKKKSKFTLPLVIYLLKDDTSVKMNTQLLALVLSSIPGLLIFVLFQKYIVGGVNVGGVKG